MISTENTREDLERLILGLGDNKYDYQEKEYLSLQPTKQMMSIREALFSIP